MIRTSIFFTAATLVTLSSAIDLDARPLDGPIVKCAYPTFNVKSRGPCIDMEELIRNDAGDLVNEGRGTVAQQNARMAASM